MTAPGDDHIAEIVAFIKQRVSALPEVAIVCGSGLSGLSKVIQDPVSVPYEDIPYFPRSTVAGHGTELVFGKLGGRNVVAQRGRFHFYEGWNMQQVTIAVRVFAALGARIMIATNAAGGVNPNFKVGDVMVITDHISLPCLSGNHPLIGHNDSRFGPRFPAVNGCYAPALQAVARSAADELQLSKYLRNGTYFHDSGPSYESPMEIHAMRVLGGDAVGMSTVPEVIIAAHAGMAVLGLSLITNNCVAPGDTTVPPSHEEVLAATDQRATDMQVLVARIVSKIDDSTLSTFPVPKAADEFKRAAAAVSLSGAKVAVKTGLPAVATAAGGVRVPIPVLVAGGVALLAATAVAAFNLGAARRR